MNLPGTMGAGQPAQPTEPNALPATDVATEQPSPIMEIMKLFGTASQSAGPGLGGLAALLPIFGMFMAQGGFGGGEENAATPTSPAPKKQGTGSQTQAPVAGNSGGFRGAVVPR